MSARSRAPRAARAGKRSLGAMNGPHRQMHGTGRPDLLAAGATLERCGAPHVTGRGLAELGQV
jgi:hypothetical protein